MKPIAHNPIAKRNHKLARSACPRTALGFALGVIAATLALTLPAAQTTLIDPTLIGFSSQDPYGVDLAAVYVTTSNGLSGPGLITDTMGNVAGGDMWQTVGTTVSTPDLSPLLTFDLGEPLNLAFTRIWNLNYSGGTQFGPKQVAILTSADGTNWSVLSTNLLLNQAGGNTNEPCQQFSTATNQVRYVQLQILATWDGTTFVWPAYGLSEIDGTDPRDFTGLSKVRFVINGVPPPFITQQPLSQVLVVPSLPLTDESMATFSVQASANQGPALTYQWRLHGTNITDNATNILGSASNMLTITNATAANLGTYTVVVTNAGGAVTSAPVTLTMATDPAGVLVDPILAGYSSQIASVRAAADVVGGVSDGLTGAGLDTDTVGNDPNPPNEALATGTMWTSDGVAASPIDQNPYLTFDLGVVGDLVNTRIWQYNQAGYLEFGPQHIRVLTSLDGVNWSILATNALNEGGGNTNEPAQDFANVANNIRYIQFQLLDTYDGAIFWSGTNDFIGNTDKRALTGLSKVRFDLNEAAPYLDVLSSGSTNAGGVQIILKATAGSGNGSAVTYQWQLNGINVTNSSNISGANTATLTINSLSVSNSGNYTLIVHDTYGSVTSAPIPVIVEVPQVSLTLNAAIHFTGVVGYHYQVEYKNALGSNTNQFFLLQDIPSLPSSPYTVYDPTPANQAERFYDVIQVIP